MIPTCLARSLHTHMHTHTYIYVCIYSIHRVVFHPPFDPNTKTTPTPQTQKERLQNKASFLVLLLFPIIIIRENHTLHSSLSLPSFTCCCRLAFSVGYHTHISLSLNSLNLNRAEKKAGSEEAALLMAEEHEASAAPQWELKKENVAPVKKGVRDVGALNAALRAREGLRSLPGKEEEARKEERR